MASKNQKKTPEAEEKQTRWTVERGSAVVKIYLTPHRGADFYTLSYWLDGKRKRQVFSTLEKAKDEAATIATQITKGDLGAAELSCADRASYLRAIHLLQPIGASLELAAAEYAAAVTRLGAVSLSQAVDFYLKRHPVHIAPKMVKEVVDELLAVKREDKLSTRYLKQLEYDMNRLLVRFKGRILDITGPEIIEWLRSLEVGPRTRNNLRNSVQVLFNFAISRKYLPKDHDELEAVPVAKDRDGEIEVFTPKEMAEILEVASPKIIPFLAISAFAGVRHAELQRLNWAQVKKESKVIEIRAGTAKTASRRVIPIVPNLYAWLEKYWQEAGKIADYANMVLQFVEVTRLINVKRRAEWAKANGITEQELKEADDRAKVRMAKLTRKERRSERAILPGAETAEDEGWIPFKWKHNALRHSFITYRVAETQNVAQVALEAGNSPRMIFQHYRELVTPEEAKRWFAISPKQDQAEKSEASKQKPNNVVDLPTAAAAA
jgi:integrase